MQKVEYFNTEQFKSIFAENLHWCESIRFAVAWITDHHESFQCLMEAKKKISQSVVGISFYQTSPSALQKLLAHSTVRIANPDEGKVFHPKIYLFTKKSEYRLVVGSSNLTNGGTSNNPEGNLLITGTGIIDDHLRQDLDGWWESAIPSNEFDLDQYTEAFDHAKSMQRILQPRRYPKKGKVKESDHGRFALGIEILRMDWETYVQRVREEEIQRQTHSLDIRLRVLESNQEAFRLFGRFGKMPVDRRKEVAGLMERDDLNFKYFGSMVGNGRFHSAVNERAPRLGEALDHIPIEGEVSSDQFQKYWRAFAQTLNGYGGNPLATATRLAAMKRPDLFLCVDSKNKRHLSKSFDIKQSITLDEYWDSIISRIQDSVWWNSPAPRNKEELRIWNGRVAMLDALFYEP